jgi:hypothetical protein
MSCGAELADLRDGYDRQSRLGSCELHLLTPLPNLLRKSRVNVSKEGFRDYFGFVWITTYTHRAQQDAKQLRGVGWRLKSGSA